MQSAHAAAIRILAALDLTRLGDADTAADIETLCAKAATPYGAPAAVCVHPPFVAVARAALDRRGLHATRIATVANFPHGDGDPAHVGDACRAAIENGADEVDVVLPYRALLRGDTAAAIRLVTAVRDALPHACLKVILESGVLQTPAAIAQAAMIAIDHGADFIKTSTGKAAVHATPAAARTMLETIRARNPHCGFKASGGIRTVEDAATYYALADEILGAGWATPQRLRIGASALLEDAVRVLRCRPYERSSGPPTLESLPTKEEIPNVDDPDNDSLPDGGGD